MDEALKHPDGRAKGGEACVICSNPVPREAHWSQRDRHVCSTHCNQLLRRRYGRRSPTIDPARIEAAREAVGPLPNPRTSGPRVFATAPDQYLPIEWEGYGPIPGDIVERYGIVTQYAVYEMPDWYYADRVIIAMTTVGESFITGATEEGWFSSLMIGAHSPDGQRSDEQSGYTFECQGVTCHWRRERITDLQPDGVNYFYWDTFAAVPVDAPPYPQPMHSARYRAEMDRRRRVAGNAAKHERRARETALIERFDPIEVYERDDWMCQICGSEVESAVLYPDPFSASLDHVIALSRGGDHTRQNTVLAHLRCNLMKAAG